ncbi:methyl-accepting chemotaxis protein [Actinoplanes sp. NPDC051346]|uniref:methyl-accepting chemotaxis protein n=1 Tax=Actinoplanes sp. NPDC051346 TaxID=3155048 RepID=UPI003426C06F
MLSLLDRVPPKIRTLIAMIFFVGGFAVLAVVTRSVAGSVAETLPEGSSGREDLERLARVALWLPVVVVPAVLILQVSVVSSLVRVLKVCASVIKSAAGGDLGPRMPVVGKDELGQMATAYNAMMDRVQTTVDGIRLAVAELNASSDSLGQVSTTMTRAAEATAGELETVVHSARRTSDEVGSIADGTQQMRVAIEEISTNTSDVSRMTDEAVAGVAVATGNVSRLRDSSQEINDVLRSINAIAAQTNLLALNATIEAARAGEAGRGFAIVAGEVKELAQATAQATEEIARRIEGIQHDTGEAVEAVSGFSAIIGAIAQHQITIAAAIEEQTATTGTMVQGAGLVSTGTEQISQAISAVSTAANEVRGAAEETHRAVGELTGTAARLRNLAEVFHS